MKAKKAKGKSSKQSKLLIAKRVVIAILILAVVGILVFGGYTVYKYFAGDGYTKNMALTHKGTMYNKDALGVDLLSGDEISVFTLKGDGEYRVEVTSYISDKNDIEFKIGNEPFKWSDTAGKTFTGGFTFTQTKDGFKIEYKSVSEIISAAYGGREVTIDEKAASGINLFKLTVTYEKESVSLTFAVGVPVEDVELKPGEIVISKIMEGEKDYD